MALTKVPMGNHPETGAPGYHHYINDDPSTVAYYTGLKAFGDFILADGTVYNVSDHVIQVASLDHALELDHHLAQSYEASGVFHTPAHESPTGEEVPFVHPVCRFCSAADAYRVQTNALMSTTAGNGLVAGPFSGSIGGSAMFVLSLHTATTSTTGASENANSGGYARQSSTWASASGGSIATSNSQTFSTGGSVAVTYVGTWTSGTYGGGTFYIGAALTAGVTSTSIVFATAAVSFSCS